MIAAAKTAPDHEMLAKHYDSAAQQLDRDATRHDGLARSHAVFGSGKASGQGLAQHCKAVP